MRGLRYLACAFVISVAACGGGGGGGDDTGDDGDDTGDDAPEFDAAIDSASTPPPDAGADANPALYDCIGEAFPTDAPDMITLSGVTSEISTGGLEPFGNVAVEAFDTADASLGAMTSNATTGAWSIQVATGGSALDGYLKGDPASTSYDAISYVYPPQALSGDQANIPILVMSDTTWAFLPLIAGASQANDKGFVGIMVVDCEGNPVAGASVTVEGAEMIKYVSGTSISQTATTTDASGLALAFNVTVADAVTVDASTSSHEFHEHEIEVRGGVASPPESAHGVITTTIVAPGPIDAIAPL